MSLNCAVFVLVSKVSMLWLQSNHVIYILLPIIYLLYSALCSLSKQYYYPLQYIYELHLILEIKHSSNIW